MDDQNSKGYQGEEHFYNSGKLSQRTPFWRRHLWTIIACIAIIFMVIFASTTIFLLTRPMPVVHQTPIQTPTPTAPEPTSTQSTPNPTTASTTTTSSSQTTVGLPCTVNINTWRGGSQDWVVQNGILYNDGSNDKNNGPTMIAPCQSGTTNYAVEVKIQVTKSTGYYNCFGIALRGSSTQNGWQGYKTDVCRLGTSYISAYGDNDPLTKADFSPGTTTHTYRAEVKDNIINFLIDGNLVDTATDNRLLTIQKGQGVGLYSQHVQLQVTSFQVTALS